MKYEQTIIAIGKQIQTSFPSMDVNNTHVLLFADRLLKEMCCIRNTTEERFDVKAFSQIIETSIQHLFYDDKSRIIAAKLFYKQYKLLSDALNVTAKVNKNVAMALTLNCEKDAVKLMIGAIIVQWILVAINYNR